MGGGITEMTKQELVATIRDRHQQASKQDEGRTLDEFTAVTGHHRKRGIRLLGGTADNQGKQAKGRRIYDSVAQLRGLYGAPWAPESRSRSEATSLLSQRSHTGPAALTHLGHCGQPTKANAKNMHGGPDRGTNLQPLELAATGFP